MVLQDCRLIVCHGAKKQVGVIFLHTVELKFAHQALPFPNPYGRESCACLLDCLGLVGILEEGKRGHRGKAQKGIARQEQKVAWLFGTPEGVLLAATCSLTLLF